MPSPIVLAGIFLTVVFSCLWYGGIGPFATLVIELSVASMALAWIVGMLWERQFVCLKTGFFIPYIVFLGYIALQCIPLPAWIVNFVSPQSLWVSKNFIPAFDPACWTTVSIAPYAGFQEFTKILTWGALFFLVLNTMRSKKDFVFLINGIIWFGVCISIFALAQHFLYSGKVYWFDKEGSALAPVGPFVMKNNFAGYVCMIIPLAIGYMLTDMPFSRRVLYAVGIALMSIAMFFSLSRGGVIVYGASLALFAFICTSRDVLRQRPSYIFLWAVIGLCAALFFMEGGLIIERLTSLFRKELFVWLGHGYSWADIIRIIRDYFFVGSGLGTFYTVSSMYKSTFDQDLFTYAHNDYLQFFSEVGLIGCCIAGWFFWRYFSYLLRAWLARRDIFVVSLGAGCMIAIAAIMMYSLLDFNLHIPSHSVLCAVILGLTYRIMFLRNDVPDLKR